MCKSSNISELLLVTRRTRDHVLLDSAMENSLSTRLQSPQIYVFGSPVIVKAKPRDIFQQLHSRYQNITPQIILALLLGSLAFGILAGLCCYFATNYPCCCRKNLNDSFDELNYSKIVVVPANKREKLQSTPIFVNNNKIRTEKNNAFNKKNLQNSENPIYDTIISNETKTKPVQNIDSKKISNDDYLLFVKKNAMKNFEKNQNETNLEKINNESKQLVESKSLNTEKLVEKDSIKNDIEEKVSNKILTKSDNRIIDLPNDTNINLTNSILNTANFSKTTTLTELNEPKISTTIPQIPTTNDSTKLPQIATLTNISSNSATLPKKEAKILHTNNLNSLTKSSKLTSPKIQSKFNEKSNNLEKDTKVNMTVTSTKPTQLIEPKIRSPQYLRSFSSPKSSSLLNEVPLSPTLLNKLSTEKPVVNLPLIKQTSTSPKTLQKRAPSTPPILKKATKNDPTTITKDISMSPRALRPLRIGTTAIKPTAFNTRSSSQPDYVHINVNNENKLRTATLESRKKGKYEIIQKPMWKYN